MSDDRRTVRRLTIAVAGLVAGLTASTAEAAPTPKPINIVTFGDSIMWGQGLTENQKFRNIVKDHLHSKAPNRPIALFNYAHSGARIEPGPIAKPSGALPTSDPSPVPLVSDALSSGLTGEIPWSLPSITQQATAPQLPVRPEDVDLILVNGGFNDANGFSFGAGGILSLDPSWPVGATDAASLTTRGPSQTLHAWLWDNAVVRMRALLPAILKRYPNATVVVVGYYAPVSAKSGEGPLRDLANRYGLGWAVPLGGSGLKTRWSTASTLAREMTNVNYRAAVEDANRNIRTTTGSGSATRAVFAELPWDDDFALAAPRARVWNLEESPASQDAIKNARFAACTSVKPQIGAGEFEKCIRASTVHPNIQGAIDYANAIDRALEPTLCSNLQVGCPFSVSGAPAGAISDGDMLFFHASRAANVTQATLGSLVAAPDGTSFRFTAPNPTTTRATVSLTFTPTDGAPGQSQLVTIPLTPQLHFQHSFDKTTWTDGCAFVDEGKPEWVRVKEPGAVEWSPIGPDTSVEDVGGTKTLKVVGRRSDVVLMVPVNGSSTPAPPPPGLWVRAVRGNELPLRGACYVKMPGKSMVVTAGSATANVPAGGRVQVFVPTPTNRGVSDPLPDRTYPGWEQVAERSIAGSAQSAPIQLSGKTSTGQTVSVEVRATATK